MATTITLKESGVKFDAENHKYTLGGKELKGITSTILNWMWPDTYKGIPEEVLNAAAEHGSYVHGCIELVELVGATDDCPESQQYLELMNEARYTCLAHEYLVSDKEEFASAIDLVLEDSEGGVVLGDIKTTYKPILHKTAAQLNIYKALFELQNPGVEVKGLRMLWLPKAEGKAKWIELPIVGSDVVAAMFTGYLNGDDPAELRKHFEPEVTAPEAMVAKLDRIAELKERMAELKGECDELEAEVKAEMGAQGASKWETGRVVVSYVKPGKRASVDSKRLKAEWAEAYKACLKESETAASVRVKLK